MTPKEKAKELVDKFFRYTPADEDFEYLYAKKCALIAVDECYKEADKQATTISLIRIDYWKKVKEEIEKL